MIRITLSILLTLTSCLAFADGQVATIWPSNIVAVLALLVAAYSAWLVKKANDRNSHHMELSMQPRLDCRLSDTDKPGGINWTVRNTGIGPAVFVNGYLSLEDNSWDLRDHSQLAGFARHLVSSSINSRPLPANLVFVEHRGSGYYQEAKTDWHVFQFPPERSQNKN